MDKNQKNRKKYFFLLIISFCVAASLIVVTWILLDGEAALGITLLVALVSWFVLKYFRTLFDQFNFNYKVSLLIKHKGKGFLLKNSTNPIFNTLKKNNYITKNMGSQITIYYKVYKEKSNLYYKKGLLHCFVVINDESISFHSPLITRYIAQIEKELMKKSKYYNYFISLYKEGESLSNNIENELFELSFGKERAMHYSMIPIFFDKSTSTIHFLFSDVINVNSFYGAHVSELKSLLTQSQYY